MQSRCLISIILEEKEMLVYETKPIKLSRMLSMSHITQSGSLYQEFCFPSLQSALPSLVSLK